MVTFDRRTLALITRRGAALANKPHPHNVVPTYRSEMLTKKELEEDLRPWVAAHVTAVKGQLNSALVDEAVDCVRKSFSRQLTTGIKSTLNKAHLLFQASRSTDL